MKLEKIVDSRAKVIDTGSVQLSPHYPGETSYATFKIANGEEWTWYSDKAATLDEGMTVLLGAWGKRETMSLVEFMRSTKDDMVCLKQSGLREVWIDL